MDTREKIVPLELLAAKLDSTKWLAVAGLFDPLTQWQAARLAQFATSGRCILAIVDPGAGCLLAAEARAILVAALRSVKLVTIAYPSVWHPLLAVQRQVEIVEDPAGERQRSADFREWIARRQAVQ